MSQNSILFLHKWKRL